MAWDFSTEPEFQAKLDWMDEFVRDEVEPLDFMFRGSAAPFDPPEEARPIIGPLKQQVRDQGLWACHLGPELGGHGYGQLKLALINEILGRTRWGPAIFGCQAPDTGNAEILAHYGTPEQKEKYLQPLLDGEIVSCYSMTEPQAGSDPQQFECSAVRDGDEWVITGEKYFSSHADIASFLIAMVITDPDVSVYKGSSMFLVPTTPPAWRSPGTWGSWASRSGRGTTATSATTTCGCPPTTSSARRAAASRSPRPASAGAGSTTPCARSGCARRRST